MKLDRKLPLAFAVVMVAMAGAGLFGILKLHQAVDTYAEKVQRSNDHARAADRLQIAFKTQVQEWKNTLLRGKDPAALDKHWAGFTKHEADVAAGATKLLAALPEGEPRRLLGEFAQAAGQMGRDYRKGFEAFKAAGADPAVGDAAVKGMDRAPSQLIDEVGEKISLARQATAVEAEAVADRATRVSLLMMLAVSTAGLVGGVMFSRSITRRLGADPEETAAVVQRVAQGDLATRISLRTGDTSSVMAGIHSMQQALSGVVHEVRQNAESVASASTQIAQGNQALSSRTEEQASALEETAATMEEMGGTMRSNADNARQANQLAQGAATVAVQGGEVVGQFVATMKGINDSSKKIADIINVIDGIAFQTNILALNAAVEAARAGEQGRGFAVVASEVRSLAQRSAQAAKEIKTLITASVEQVEHGTLLVDRAGHTMEEIVGAIKRVTDIVAEISAASTEQSTGITQVSEAVSQMDQVTQQNAALVEESAAAAESLKHQAQRLVQTVAVFRLDIGRPANDGTARRGPGLAA